MNNIQTFPFIPVFSKKTKKKTLKFEFIAIKMRTKKNIMRHSEHIIIVAQADVLAHLARQIR